MRSQKSQIKVDQVGIGKILKDFTLIVPSHQRDYSWTDLEVRTLLQDLAKAISDNEPGYFLGTIVTIPGPSGRLEVIDGQQRLATITILLCQIRRYLREKDDIIAEDIKTFLFYTDRNQRAVVPRLRLNNADNDFFGAMLSDEQSGTITQPTSKSHRLITAAFKVISNYIDTIVGGFDAKVHGDILNKWINFVEFGADVILLQVPSGGNAYKMFETLNDRGLKTTQADLVKNYLFSQAGDRLTEAEHAWSQMRGVLELIQEEEKEDITVTFFRHALMVIQGFLRKNEVYEAVQHNGKGTQAAVAFLRKTEALSTAYVATFYRDHEKWSGYPDAIRPAILTLNFFDIHPFRPMLLAIAAKFPPKEAVRAFELLISLGVRLLIASSTRTGSVEEAVAKAAQKAFASDDCKALDLKKDLSEIIPSDERFRQAFEIATVSSGPLARYYLRTLERVAKKEADPLFTVSDDKEVVTLEHILPRKPEGNWPQFSPEEADNYWKRIGNMALLQQKTNSDMKSACWADKRQNFKGHGYELTAQVAAVPDWNVEAICRRQAELAKLALKAWPV
ncbi:MAG: DUF262 domain-containing protein [Desulfobacteraceae bacterium]|nr:MAG: DUF262 domain-containing protein [Desulfobacteraceae bacterium]